VTQAKTPRLYLLLHAERYEKVTGVSTHLAHIADPSAVAMLQSANLFVVVVYLDPIAGFKLSIAQLRLQMLPISR